MGRGIIMSKTYEEIMAAFAAPFSAGDVDWRITSTTKEKDRGLAVPYVKSRAIQTRLDEVVGPYNWRTNYTPWHSVGQTASQLCGLAVYCEERKEWIQKCDGAENTDYEPVKGGISDSFKRAAVVWGIGRYLYGIDGIWVDIEQKGKSYVIPNRELKRLAETYQKAVNAPPGNVSLFPGNRTEPAPIPLEHLHYDYSISSVEPRQFASGNGMVLRLQSVDGKSVEAFLQQADNSLAHGVCLKNVKLTPFESGGYRSHIMDGYEVA